MHFTPSELGNTWDTGFQFDWEYEELILWLEAMLVAVATALWSEEAERLELQVDRVRRRRTIHSPASSLTKQYGLWAMGKGRKHARLFEAL